MGHLLHSLGFSVLLFVAVFVIGFLYQWVLFLRPQSLGVRHFQAKRYAEAADTFQQVLRRRPPSGIEADTRRRLADTLDILGRTEEAAAERERAGVVAMKNVGDPMSLMAQGDLLSHQGRHNDACPFFDRALSLTPAMPGSGRAHIMAKLALAHHHAGRSAETLRWAQASLDSGPDKTVRLLMHRMAGIAFSDQGELGQAEAQHRLALALAEAAGKPVEIAQSLTLLASIQHKRGQFEEAIAACRRARELARAPARTDIAVEAECLRDMGRFEEARAVMRRHFDGSRFDQPATERKMQALGSLGMAWIEARAEQPDAAWEHLEAARAGLQALAASTVWPPPPGGEEKLALWCDATAVNVLAQQGNFAEARRLLESVERRLPPFASDFATLRGVFGHLGRAALQMGDFAESRRFFQQYRDYRPTPATLPTIDYHFGEIALRLGEPEQARAAFRQAIAPGIPSLEAHRAQARLDELGAFG